MKTRHLIPWIPILGIIMVMAYPLETYYRNNKGEGFLNYLWGNIEAYYGSMFYQAICVLIPILLIK